ncbi:MAG: hypothetical protein ACREFF_05630 [Candidatus Udaeobacter sp.]
MAEKKGKKKIKLQDLKPKKDAKGGCKPPGTPVGHTPGGHTPNFHTP